jgi:heptosyltransferase-2
VPASTHPPNILIVRFSSIGDILLTTPLLRALRQRHPAARITILTKQAYTPLLSDNPRLNEVIGLEAGGSLASLASLLRAASYTHHLDLHGNLRSLALRALVPARWSGYPKHRLARALLIRNKRNYYRDWRPVPERYFRAARGLDVTPDGGPPEFFLGSAAEQQATAWLATTGLPSKRTLIAIAPGAAHATKRWPPEHWQTLLSRIVADGFSVILVGGPDDAQLGAALTRSAPPGVANAAGILGLQETGALLRRAAALVSGDTGVMHMATGVGTPVVALFGPTVKAFGFFPYTARATVVELELPCRPCSKQGGSRCPLGHHRCLVDLEPDRVYDAVRRRIA